MALMGEDRKVNIREVGAVVLWLAAFSLVTMDLLMSSRELGHLAAYGGLVACGAVTVTVYCIAVNHLHATCERLHNAFVLGQDSVRRLHR